MAIINFASFYRGIHRREAFDWQVRLADRVAATGWPEYLDLPTAAGKTAVLDVAVHALACEAGLPLGERRAPMRIAFVVDRRVVVDDVAAYASHIADKLSKALISHDADPAVAEAARRLAAMSGDIPLLVSVLRGGAPHDRAWTRSPSQPTICVSTVDQVGSLLLFRGYGVSNGMQPVHAGLLGIDCLFVVDEAHLSAPFVRTLRSAASFSGPSWRSAEVPLPALRTAVMSATLPPTSGTATDMKASPDVFHLDHADLSNDALSRRLSRPKPAQLIGPASEEGGKEDKPRRKSSGRNAGKNVDKISVKATAKTAPASQPTDAVSEAIPASHAATFVHHALRLLDDLPALPEARMGTDAVVGIVVNRVGLAREIATLAQAARPDAQVTLLTGRVRPAERDRLLKTLLPALRPGRTTETAPSIGGPRIVVATQCIEAGADLDFDILVSELAALDALRQRFGRLNRIGTLDTGVSAIIAPAEIPADDPVYGTAMASTWAWLHTVAVNGIVDMAGLSLPLPTDPAVLGSLLSPTGSSLRLLPAHLDTLAQTSPRPSAEPVIAHYLHGFQAPEADINIVWRADVPHPNAPMGDSGTSPGAGAMAADRENAQAAAKQAAKEAVAAATRQALALCPPLSAEALPIPLAVARSWLRRRGTTDVTDLEAAPAASADDAGTAAHTAANALTPDGDVYRWGGPDDQGFVALGDLRPGDVIVVPASAGGCDRFGWHPQSGKPVEDIATAVHAAAGTTVLRLHRSLYESALRSANNPADPDGRSQAIPVSPDDGNLNATWDTIEEALRSAAEDNGGELDDADALAVLSGIPGLPPAIQAILADLDLGRGRNPDLAYYDPSSPWHGFVAARTGPAASWSVLDLAEGDRLTSAPVALTAHSDGVVAQSTFFAEAIGLPKGVADDVAASCRWHDIGKAEGRNQILLHGSDAVAAMAAPEPLAKSAPGALGRNRYTAARRAAGLPDGFRHECWSVALLRSSPILAGSNDPDLVVWLVGAHHGHGRPWFPVVPDIDTPITVDLFGHHLQASTVHGLEGISEEWPALFDRLQRRYGWWGLAYLEAVMRLSDHRQSAKEAANNSGTASARTTNRTKAPKPGV